MVNGAVKLRTRVFVLAPESGYRTNQELARGMGLSEAQVSRVRRGLVGINQCFIEGARRAFPDKSLDELFTVEPEEQVA